MSGVNAALVSTSSSPVGYWLNWLMELNQAEVSRHLWSVLDTGLIWNLSLCQNTGLMFALDRTSLWTCRETESDSSFKCTVVTDRAAKYQTLTMRLTPLTLFTSRHSTWAEKQKFRNESATWESRQERQNRQQQRCLRFRGWIDGLYALKIF